MKIEDFNLSDSELYTTTPKPITMSQAGKIVFDKMENANLSDFAKNKIMRNAHLWVDILKPDGLQRLNELNAKNDDFLLLRLLDD